MESTTTNANVEEKTKVIKGIVKAVAYAVDTTNRVIITTNQTFKSLDGQGKEIETDSFGIATTSLIEFASHIPEIALAKKLAMGKNINGLVFALVLPDYEIEVTRELKHAGEPRETEGQVYTVDCWKTTDIKFGKKLQPMADIEKPFLLEAIRKPLEWKKSTIIDTSKLDFE